MNSLKLILNFPGNPQHNITKVFNGYSNKNNNLLIHFHEKNLISSANAKIAMNFYKVKYDEVLVHKQKNPNEFMTVVEECDGKMTILKSDFIDVEYDIHFDRFYQITSETKTKTIFDYNDICKININKVDTFIALSKKESVDTTSMKPVQIYISDLFEDDKLFQKRPQIYDMSIVTGKNRGRCFILNYKKFTNNEFSERNGTEFDVFRLRLTFKKLGFKVKICHDKSYNDTIEALQNEATKQDTDHKIFVLVILSHGETGGFICADNEYCSYVDAYSYFDSRNCPILHGKPKVFIVQACQGYNTNYGFELSKIENDFAQSSQLEKTTEDKQIPSYDGLTFSKISETFKSKVNQKTQEVTSYEIPKTNSSKIVSSILDRLEIYSSVDGFVSYKLSTDGSWLIQSLCDVLDKHALAKNSEKYDLEKMFRITKNIVAKKNLIMKTVITKNDKTEEKIEFVTQLCDIKSTLEDKLIFFN